MKTRVLVAMSGGVDSSVAAYLLKKQGYEVIGLTFQLYDYSRLNRREGKGGCCSIEDVDDAKLVANRLGIKHYLCDSRSRFRHQVIDYFANAYRNGETPNPCVACNTFIKFDELEHYAQVLNASYYATGHYVRLDRQDGQLRLEKAVDEAKDQSYFMMGVNPERLKKSLFPCGEYTKEQIRQFAQEAGVCVSRKKESMEICFVAQNNYRRFLKEEYAEPDRQGEIVNTAGEVVGTHSGIHHFTLGQRKGLGALGLNAHYVVRLEPKKNQVVVGEDNDLYSTAMEVDARHFQEASRYQGKSLEVKIRSRSPLIPVRIVNSSPSRLLAQFEEPQRAVTPGQFAVFYDGAKVLGGGAILEPVAKHSA